MVVTVILLLAIIVALVLLAIFKKDWLASIFGNSITAKVERKKKIDGEVEVLRKQEKVECERVQKDFNAQREMLTNQTNSEIARLKAEIKRLENNKDTQFKIIDEQQKVVIDETIKEFDRKILNKINKSKRLEYFIDAEQKNIDDVINPQSPNAPTPTKKKILNEDKNVD